MYEFAKDISNEIKNHFMNFVIKHKLSYSDIQELNRWSDMKRYKRECKK